VGALNFKKEDFTALKQSVEEKFFELPKNAKLKKWDEKLFFSSLNNYFIYLPG